MNSEEYARLAQGRAMKLRDFMHIITHLYMHRFATAGYVNVDSAHSDVLSKIDCLDYGTSEGIKFSFNTNFLKHFYVQHVFPILLDETFICYAFDDSLDVLIKYKKLT